LGVGLLVAIGQVVPGPFPPALAESREAERAREQAQQAAERAREQAQQAAERAREQAQQAAERTREQTQQAAERSREQPRQATETAEQRSSTKDQPHAEKSASVRKREEHGKSRNDQDDDGPPKTMVELIKRMTASGPKGRHIDRPGSHALASSEILAVGLRPEAIARARAMGFRIGTSSRGHGSGHVVRLVPPAGLDAASARDLLRSEMLGGRVGLNYAYRPYRSAGEEKDDTSLRPRNVQRASVGGCDAARCYGPTIIGWQPQLQSCTTSVRIGVIDTSIDRDHPAFRERNVEIGNFLPKGAVRTINWHGTGVLAVLAGSPNSGTPGLVPDAHFFAADVYHADGAGQPIADTASLLDALDWMRGSKVNVVNMSMSGPYDELLQNAIADMSSRGVVFVAAAGNGGPNAPPSYPAAYEQVIAVTAVDKNLRSYIHASHGDYIDVAAPGVGIWTAIPDVLEGYQSGTSFAVPHVTAIVAAAYGQVEDKSKQGFLRALAIRDLGPAGRDPIYGRGLVTAPSTCSSEGAPSGWTADVVHAPAHLPPIKAGLTHSLK
jgi:subtilisin family serine protease